MSHVPPISPISTALRAIVADDDDQSLQIAALILRDLGMEVRTVHTGLAALRILEEEGADLVVTDLVMPQMDGQEFLQAAREHSPQLPIVIMSGQDSVERAVGLLQMGATDYIAKPLRLVEFRSRILAVIERLQLQEEVASLRRELEDELDVQAGIVLGSAPAMLRVWRKLRRVARTSAPVILLGESGTGKEVLARALHSWSPRMQGAFVTVNCGSVPEGLWESEMFGHRRGAFTGAQNDQVGLIAAANDGTLFLDEVGEIPLPSQAKLLRFLESKEYRRLGDTKMQQANVRIVSATNRNLADMVKESRFREDLFYRLNVVTIVVPPLRERMSDLPELAAQLLLQAASQFDLEVQALTPLALERLMTYSWPGNIRELRNKLQQAVAASAGPLLTADELDLPHGGQRARPSEVGAQEASSDDTRPLREARREVIDRFEREYVKRLLEKTGGNVSRAAVAAGLPRKALTRMILRHDLKSFGRARRGRPPKDHPAPLREDAV